MKFCAFEVKISIFQVFIRTFTKYSLKYVKVVKISSYDRLCRG